VRGSGQAPSPASFHKGAWGPCLEVAVAFIFESRGGGKLLVQGHLHPWNLRDVTQQTQSVVRPESGIVCNAYRFRASTDLALDMQ
jgi:hypothetical protein